MSGHDWTVLAASFVGGWMLTLAFPDLPLWRFCCLAVAIYALAWVVNQW